MIIIHVFDPELYIIYAHIRNKSTIKKVRFSIKSAGRKYTDTITKTLPAMPLKGLILELTYAFQYLYG